LNEQDPILRICIDLNIWFRYHMAGARGHNNTRIRCLIDMMIADRCQVGPVRFVMSHPMLERLTAVLLDHFPKEQALNIVEMTRSIVSVERHPLLVLGGGVEPTKDAIRNFPQYNPAVPSTLPGSYDPEDGRVLDAAIAGQADAIVTDNFKDFWYHQAQVIEFGRLIVRKTAAKDIAIIQPDLMLGWLQSGVSPIRSVT